VIRVLRIPVDLERLLDIDNHSPLPRAGLARASTRRPACAFIAAPVMHAFGLFAINVCTLVIEMDASPLGAIKVDGVGRNIRYILRLTKVVGTAGSLQSISRSYDVYFAGIPLCSPVTVHKG